MHDYATWLYWSFTAAKVIGVLCVLGLAYLAWRWL